MSEGEAGKVLTGADVMARGRRTLDLPSGGQVIIGRVEVDDLSEAIGGLPDVSSLAAPSAQNSAAAARSPEAKAFLKGMARVIRHGVIEPELFEKRKDGATPLDFSLEDRSAMFQAILELSGFTKAAGKEVLPLSKTGA
jgi:hypothetical protein